jgi:hypothetical protein
LTPYLPLHLRIWLIILSMQDKSFVKKVNKKSAGFTYRMKRLCKSSCCPYLTGMGKSVRKTSRRTPYPISTCNSTFG